MANLQDPRIVRVSFRSAANALPQTHYVPTEVIVVGRFVRAPGRTLCGKLASKEWRDTQARLCAGCAQIAVKMALRSQEEVGG